MSEYNLESKTPTEIRRNWVKYNPDTVPEDVKTLVYNNWYSTSGASQSKVSNKYKSMLKQFVFSNGIELGIKEDNSSIRRGIHDFCSKLGLDHISEDVKGTYLLCISKPANWCWEFNKSAIQQKRDEKGKKKYYKPRRVRECEGCGVTDSDTELMTSYFDIGLFCEDCLDVYSDDEGGKLSDHKFEPI